MAALGHLGMDNANLSFANCKRANLAFASLQDAILSFVNFDGPNLSAANLESTYIEGVIDQRNRFSADKTVATKI
jgi:uncharacterized protein YjbI with pentapeptide repeats